MNPTIFLKILSRKIKENKIPVIDPNWLDPNHVAQMQQMVPETKQAIEALKVQQLIHEVFQEILS